MTNEDTVFKICTQNEWQNAKRDGTYHGSNDDRRDGFVHLSTASQLAGTLSKHFAGQHNLLLIAFRSIDLEPDLKWEASRNGELFPHVYGALRPDVALWAATIEQNTDGTHRLPSKVFE